MTRSYCELRKLLTPVGDRQVDMRRFVDAAWETLGTQGVSWIGFYLPGEPGELVLGPSRNKPACSPIGLHGACGRAWRAQQPLIVTDVARLGADYIACDPRDRAELVIPLFEADGGCWGVLDVDSHEPGAFDRADLCELAELLVLMHLGVADDRLTAPIVI